MPFGFADPSRRRVVRVLGVLLVGALVCVPALARALDRSKLSSSATSGRFSKSYDSPPKKTAVAPVLAIAALLSGDHTIRLLGAARPLTATYPRPRLLSAPRPLRAPPLATLA